MAPPRPAIERDSPDPRWRDAPFRYGGPLFILTVVGLLLGINGAISRHTSRHIVAPLDALRQRAERLGVGDLEEPLEPAGDAEVYAMMQSFEQMRVRLRDGVARTPADQERYLAVIHEKSLYLERLLEELFAFSRVEYEGLRIQGELINLPELIEEIALEFAGAIELRTTVQDLAPGELWADRHHLRRALTNIFENANSSPVWYSPVGQRPFRQRPGAGRCAPRAARPPWARRRAPHPGRRPHRRFRVPQPGASNPMSDVALIIEDDRAIGELERDYLESHGFEVLLINEGAAGIAWIEEHRTPAPHIGVLDLMLPGIDGFAIARRIRAISDIPIVIVTARDAEIDVIRGGGGGAPVELTAKELAILQLLMERPNWTLTRDEIYSAVWGTEAWGEPRNAGLMSISPQKN